MASFREKLGGDEVLLGFCMMYPAPGIIERVGPDWDWFWIDGQHGELGYNDQLAMVRACDHAGKAAFVRVADHAYGAISRALDMAPTGIIVPCVDTPDQARAIVDAAKLPPLGKRSYGGRRPIDLHGRLYSDSANDEVLLVCQIESPEAVDNVDAIAALDGVDALFLGPDDILLRRGARMDVPRTPELLKPDMTAMAEACKRHGKTAVIPAGNAEVLALARDLGYRMIVAGGDVGAIVGASKAMSEAARKTLAEGKGGNTGMGY